MGLAGLRKTQGASSLSVTNRAPAGSAGASAGASRTERPRFLVGGTSCRERLPRKSNGVGKAERLTKCKAACFSFWFSSSRGV